MSEARYAFTPPNHAVLRWLADPGRHVSLQIRSMLLGELFSSPKAVIAGVVNGLILNIVALCLHSGAIFAYFMLIDIVLVTARIVVVRRAVNAAAHGMPTPTDLYLVTAGSWCGLQGAMAFAAMWTGILPLQLLSATTVMGLIGPICARNYAAPRYALMLVALCDMPFVAGAALSGNRWLLVLVLQSPLFLFGVITIIRRFQSMAIATLQAEQDSRHRARHDTLTGLLNRFGLMETLDTHFATSPRVHPVLSRPGRLQADQRHIWAPDRRQDPAGGRRPSARFHPCRGYRFAFRGRRVRHRRAGHGAGRGHAFCQRRDPQRGR